jgi:hypothetical protein
MMTLIWDITQFTIIGFMLLIGIFTILYKRAVLRAEKQLNISIPPTIEKLLLINMYIPFFVAAIMLLFLLFF